MAKDRLDDAAPETNDVVGYKRPPKHFRFRSGQSGNPRGRPKGTKNFKTVVSDVAHEVLTVREDDQPVRRTALKLVIRVIRDRMCGGDVKAFRIWHELERRFAPQESGSTGGFIATPEMLTPEEWTVAAERMRERHLRGDFGLKADSTD